MWLVSSVGKCTLLLILVPHCCDYSVGKVHPSSGSGSLLLWLVLAKCTLLLILVPHCCDYSVDKVHPLSGSGLYCCDWCWQSALFFWFWFSTVVSKVYPASDSGSLLLWLQCWQSAPYFWFWFPAVVTTVLAKCTLLLVLVPCCCDYSVGNVHPASDSPLLWLVFAKCQCFSKDLDMGITLPFPLHFHVSGDQRNLCG